MCSFCNQHIISGVNARVTRRDIESALETAVLSLGEKTHSTQIAFFGGSFTAVDRDYMIYLLESAVPYISKFNGIRISTRPDAIDDEVLSVLKKYGVKAIELGAQSMDDEVLRLNRRGHTAEHVEKASALIKEHGFELGLQMMTGLYGDTDEKALQTAEKLALLEPETVRIYPTVVLEGTELDRLYKSGEYIPQTLDEAVDLCVKLIPIFESRGIKIIRMGLHDSEDVKGRRTAGAYHPAFRELCLGRLYLNKTLELLKNIPCGNIKIYVNGKNVSQMTGHKKINILKLKEMGYGAKVYADNSLGNYDIRITV